MRAHREEKRREIFRAAPAARRGGERYARNAAMIVYDGDFIKLGVNSMYVFGTANESRPHLRAGLVGAPGAAGYPRAAKKRVSCA